MRRVFTNFAVVLAIVACGGVAAVVGWRMGRPAQPAASPASKLVAAVRSMQAADSYQFSGQVTIGIEVLHLSGTFSPPDRLHETLQLTGGPLVERVIVGAVTYQRVLIGWQRVAGSATIGDPRSTFNALLAATNVTRSGSSYSFQVNGASASRLVSGSSAATVVNGTASVHGSWVQSLTYHSAAGAGTTVALTYSAAGTAPPVTAPATAA